MRLAQDFCRSYTSTVAAANVTTRAAALGRREVAARMSHVGALGADQFRFETGVPLGQWSKDVPYANAV